MIANVTYEKMKEKFGAEEGFKRFAEIAKLGGFGIVTRDHTGGVDPAYKGGLDIKGLSNVEGEGRLSDAALQKIQELAGSEAAPADTKEVATKTEKKKEDGK